MRRFLLAVAGITAAVALAVPPASAQAPTEDSVTGQATGGPGFFGDIQIDVRSGPSGENPTGTAFFRIGGDQSTIQVGGQVTCLAVSGNTATLVVEDEADEFAGSFGFVAIQVVDNAGTGAPDTFDSRIRTDPSDCTPVPVTLILTPIASGDIVVVDAAQLPLPTSKEQCKNGGWREFGFKNQGECVAFVERHPQP
jgi:hypothetical protein